MKYILYSTLILALLTIHFSANAQKIDSTEYRQVMDSLNQLGEKYDLKNTDTVLTAGHAGGGYFGPDGTYFANPDDKVWSSYRTAKYYGAVIAGHQLKENGLVVVLRTRSSQLDKLGVLSRDNTLESRQRENIKARIAAIEHENNLINKALLMAFSNDYRFSDCYFIYDSSLTQLKEGVSKGIFLNSEGVVDNSIELLTPDFYICNFTLASASNQAEGLIIYDSKMKRVEEPFPGVAVSGSSGLNMLLQLLTSSDEHYNRIIQKDVEKLQRNLSVMMEKGDRKFKKSSDE